MTKLASGKMDEEIPALENGDEVGEMARAVQVFKNSMLENERLRAEQEALKAEAEQLRRRRCTGWPTISIATSA
ncbi:MAG: hypothetical protein WDO24_01235 [Pseudomonadota bacterium]